jgi:hypothetical protein
VIVPRAAFQDTDLSVEVPATVALNCKVWPASVEAGDGVMLTPVTPDAALTVMLITLAAASMAAADTKSGRRNSRKQNMA